MKKRIFASALTSAALLVGFGLTTQSARAADIAIQALAAPCAGCHGPDGASIGLAMPTIAGLPKEYFTEAMVGYKTDLKPSTVMGRIAKGYSDKQMERLATYFAEKPFVRSPQPVDEARVAKGKALVGKYCERCHENEGRDADGVGVLAGQKLIYMQFSVADFLSGKREMEKRQKRKFDELLADHGKDAFDDILHYYASVK
jgi:cytochrome subunit of sulfide dehydrogenase